MKRLSLLVVALLLGGCATLVAPASTQVPPTEVSPTPSVPPALAVPVPTSWPSPLMSPMALPLTSPLTSPLTAPADSAFVDQAKADLATRLEIDAAQIQIVSFDQVEWPDASVGCPKLGVMYIQVITPGYKIVLSAHGKTYEYHGKSKDAPALCEK